MPVEEDLGQESGRKRVSKKWVCGCGLPQVKLDLGMLRMRKKDQEESRAQGEVHRRPLRVKYGSLCNSTLYGTHFLGLYR